MTQLKFYKKSSAPTGVAQGSIWFNTSDRTINVYTGTTWEKYAGLVDASLSGDNRILTIVGAAGNEIKLDVSDLASASSVNTAITRLEGLITANTTEIGKNKTAAENAQKAADAADAAVKQEVTDRQGEITRVEGLISAEASRADAAEKLNAAAAKAADDKAAAAQTYAEGVNTALGQEVDRATKEEARIAGLVSAEETRAKGVEDELRGLITSAASGATTEVKEADGGNTHVKVAESTGASGQKIYTISESDIASAQGLTDEIGRATAAEEGLAGRIDALDKAETGRVSVLEAKVEALSSATHFIGVKDALPETAADGDIVIVGEKEYIYDSTHDPKWVELGDTTAEANRISALEGWKTTASQSIADNTAAIESNDADILALQNRAKTIEDNIANNIATKKELADEKSALEAQITSNDTDIKNLQDKDAEFDEWIDAHETAFEELTTAVNGKVAQGVFDTLSGKVSTAEGKITNLETGVADLEAATGFAEKYVANTGANYISGATSLKDADDKLDAAIKAVAQSVEAKNVEAQGDEYVSASAAGNKVTVAAVVADSIGDGSAKALATVKAVHDALAWAEFA